MNEARIEAVVKKAVSRKMRLFQNYRDIQPPDLVSECMIAVRKGIEGYKPRKGAWSTYVYRIAHCRIIDIHRRRERQSGYERMAARPEMIPAAPREPVPPSTRQWLVSVYQAAVAKFSPRGVETLSARQFTIACFCLREQRSTRDAAELLSRPGYMAAMGMTQPVTKSTVNRAMKRMGARAKRMITQATGAE